MLPKCQWQLMWTQARIMVEEDDYVVLNKPPGVQVTPTVGQPAGEHASCWVPRCGLHPLQTTLPVAQTQILSARLLSSAPGTASTASVIPCVQAIGREEPLLITHRLDTCTEGVLIMGKTKAFVQHFNAAMMTKAALQKTYRALTRTSLSTGMTNVLNLYVPALKPQVHELSQLMGNIWAMSCTLCSTLVHGRCRCSDQLCVHQAAAERQRRVHRRAGAGGARQPALRAGDHGSRTGQRLRQTTATPDNALLRLSATTAQHA